MKLRSVAGYEGLYQVSETGIVISLEREITSKKGIKRQIKRKEITARKNNRGYLYVRLNKNGLTKAYLVHRLVAAGFIPNPEALPQVNHLDGDRLNNQAENLEWAMASSNMKHAYKTGLNTQCGCAHTQAVAWIDTKTGLIFCTIKAFCDFFGIPYGRGHKALYGKSTFPDNIDLSKHSFERYIS